MDIIVKDGIAVYGPAATLTETGTRTGNRFDPTTTTVNAAVVSVPELPPHWRPGCFTWDGETLAPTASYLEEVLPLAKAEKLEILRQEKKAARDGGVTLVVNGESVTFDTDDAAQQQYTNLRSKIVEDPQYSVEAWQASKGQWVKMDAGLFARVEAAATTLLQDTFTWLHAREQEVEAAETISAVASVSETFTPGEYDPGYSPLARANLRAITASQSKQSIEDVKKVVDGMASGEVKTAFQALVKHITGE